MGDCAICGASTLGHRCRGCGEIHCESHILPENHDCVALSIETSDGQWFNTKFESIDEGKRPNQDDTKPIEKYKTERSEPTPDPNKNYTVAEANADNPNYQTDDYETVDVGEDRTYGSAEPVYESSPDVNPDGSIKTKENTEPKTSNETDVESRFSNLQLAAMGFVVLSVAAYLFYLI